MGLQGYTKKYERLEVILTKEHIVVVEDDQSLSEWIKDYLENHDYRVSIASRGDIAISLIESEMPDIVLLDIMLPIKNGFEVCKAIRQFYPRPILMMTACDEESDEVLGLELGADDYINKPVRPRALLARLKALLRRNSVEPDKKVVTVGSLRILSESKTVLLDEKPLPITSNEFDVLWLLASRAGQVVSRTELVSLLRGFDYNGFDRSIDIRVSRLRKKLKDNLDCPQVIKTIRGKGYLFVGDEW